MSEEQRKWIERIRERMNEETDPSVCFQLLWELDQLLARSQIGLDSFASRHPDGENSLFGRSKELVDLLISSSELAGAESRSVRPFDFSILQTQGPFSALVENSDDFIGFASAVGQAQFVNPAGRELVGLREDLVRRTVPLDYVAEEDQQLLSAGVAMALANGNWEGQVRFRNFKSGTLIPVFQHIFNVRDTGMGQQFGLGTISQVITERNRSQGALGKFHSTLQPVSRIVCPGEMNADAAREIEQLLQSILRNADTCTRILGAVPAEPEVLRAAVEDITSVAKRASEVISSIVRR